MTRLPLDPKLAAALLAAEAGGCTEELLTIAAMLSVQSIWAGGRDRRKAADAAKLLCAADSAMRLLIDVLKRVRSRVQGEGQGEGQVAPTSSRALTALATLVHDCMLLYLNCFLGPDLTLGGCHARLLHRIYFHTGCAAQCRHAAGGSIHAGCPVYTTSCAFSACRSRIRHGFPAASHQLALIQDQAGDARNMVHADHLLVA